MSFEDLNFECPQFVDFENLDAEEDDTFFDRLSETHDSENEFQRQIPAVVSRTPLRADKGNSSRQQERNRRNITDSEKRRVVSHRRISKSLNDLSQACNVKEPNPRGKRLQKRSASEDDLKNKKRHNPITPTCLKRTIEKGKSKKILSTEERELVKIAEMRKQMADHLRLNKAAMKKISQKQYHPAVGAGPSGLAKPPPHFTNRTQTKNAAAANFTLDKKLIAAKKEPRKFDPPKPCVVKDDAKPVFSREKTKSSVEELANLNISVFNASKSSAETTSDSDLFKIPEARGVGHGGVKLVGNKKKKTVPLPFNFKLETRMNSDNKTPRHSKHGNENLFKIADANTQEKLKERKTPFRRSDKPICSKMLYHSDEETTGNAGPSKVLKEINVLKTHEKVERRARPKSEYTYRKQRPQFDFSTLKSKPLNGRSDSESTAE